MHFFGHLTFAPPLSWGLYRGGTALPFQFNVAQEERRSNVLRMGHLVIIEAVVKGCLEFPDTVLRLYKYMRISLGSGLVLL